MVHQIRKNLRAGRKACKEMCDYLGFVYLDPIGEEDGRNEKHRMTLENKRVKRTALEKIYAQAMMNTPPGWTPVVSIRQHQSNVAEAYVVLKARDFKCLLEIIEEKP